jgi:hypothetical protein
MKNKIFLVEMTNNDDWEMNHGFHLAIASSKDQVKDIINEHIKELYPDIKIFNITNLKDFIGNKIIKTILFSQTE